MLDCWGNFREWDRGSLKTCSCQFLENEFLWQCILNLLGRDFQSFMTLVKYSDINLGMKWISFVSRLQSKTFIFLANYTYSQIPFEQKVIFLVILNFLVYFYYQRSWYKPSIKCHVHLIHMSRTSIICQSRYLRNLKSFPSIILHLFEYAEMRTIIHVYCWSMLIMSTNLTFTYQNYLSYSITDFISSFELVSLSNIITIINISSTRLLLGRICMILVHSLTWQMFMCSEYV